MNPSTIRLCRTSSAIQAVASRFRTTSPTETHIPLRCGRCGPIWPICPDRAPSTPLPNQAACRGIYMYQWRHRRGNCPESRRCFDFYQPTRYYQTVRICKLIKGFVFPKLHGLGTVQSCFSIASAYNLLYPEITPLSIAVSKLGQHETLKLNIQD